MVELWEKRVRFVFDHGWDALKYDAEPKDKASTSLTYYKKHLARLDRKACDFVATDGSTTFLIEVKDYGEIKDWPPAELTKHVARKALDTLGGLVAIREAAGDRAQFAATALASSDIRLVLSVGVPDKQGPLSDPAGFAIALEKKLVDVARHVLPRPRVQLFGNPGPAWTTTVHRTPGGG